MAKVNGAHMVHCANESCDKKIGWIIEARFQAAPMIFCAECGNKVKRQTNKGDLTRIWESIAERFART